MGLAILVYSLNIGSLYNAYADDLLNLGLFSSKIREIQDAWYYKKTGQFLIDVIDCKRSMVFL